MRKGCARGGGRDGSATGPDSPGICDERSWRWPLGVPKARARTKTQLKCPPFELLRSAGEMVYAGSVEMDAEVDAFDAESCAADDVKNGDECGARCVVGGGCRFRVTDYHS